MNEFRSSELLALLIDEKMEEIEIFYSSLFHMIAELRQRCIFCDLTSMDFEDLSISYPGNINVYRDKIFIRTSGIKITPYSTNWDTNSPEVKSFIKKSFKKHMNLDNEK